MIHRNFLAAAVVLLAMVGAQGGDAVYRSLRTEIPIEREYLEPQGLQDAAFDLLTADMSTMSSTYVSLMSASVTVGEAGDAVLARVTGQLGWMGAALYVVNYATTSGEMWQMERPDNPALATNQGSFPSGLTNPEGITSHGGAVYVVNASTPDEMWRCADPTSPGTCANQGSFPSGLTNPRGITSHGGAVYVVDGTATGDEMWRCADPTSPGTCTNQGSFPSGLMTPEGITSHGGAVYVVDAIFDEMWRCADPTSPGTCTNQGSFPSGLTTPRAITSIGEGPLHGTPRARDDGDRRDHPSRGSYPARRHVR